MIYQKVLVIGLDGLDPGITEAMMTSGELPHLAALKKRGMYGRLATTLPAQTPVAWSTFAVGANPGVCCRLFFMSSTARIPDGFISLSGPSDSGLYSRSSPDPLR